MSQPCARCGASMRAVDDEITVCDSCGYELVALGAIFRKLEADRKAKTEARRRERLGILRGL